ncbi:alkaline shock response membrane anchor protein AmaP [Citricoccus sp. NR2]|uniref:alkaline shock response membrane anchor protein AmaP n=1 Tax=Citricoccus sp. NR2 TaxID=3004095 RepID=UPI0022DD596D|nr:alkaline shock response membrane anchor protein AmaP [Citricoccus sp. NR2]WBL19959.1 alkaline shock response membrane anchor protein AmaP [Citricoccus sp. NR2]
MKTRAGVLNRVLLGMLGTLLLAIGVTWGLIAAGVFAGVDPVLAPEARPWAGATTVETLAWLPAVVVAVGMMLAAAGLAWVIAQIPRSRRAATLRFHADARTGTTVMDAAVLTDAVAATAETLDDVVAARAVLRGARRDAELAVQVTVQERGDVAAVVRRVHDEVLPQAVQALGVPLSAAGILVDVTRQSGRRHEVRVQ